MAESAKKSSPTLVSMKEGAQRLLENSLIRTGTAVGILVFCVGGAWSASGWMSKIESQGADQARGMTELVASVRGLAEEMKTGRKEDSKAMWDQVAALRTEIRDLRDKIIRMEARQP